MPLFVANRVIKCVFPSPIIFEYLPFPLFNVHPLGLIIFWRRVKVYKYYLFWLQIKPFKINCTKSKK